MRPKLAEKKTHFTKFFPIEGKQPKFFLMNPNHFEGQTLYPKRSKIAIVEHGDLATAQKFNFHAKFQKTKFSKNPTFSIEIPKMECV